MRKILAYSLSVLFGFLIWAVSVPLTGSKEPWDAGGAAGFYYPVELFLAGFITRFIAPVKPIGLAVGVYVGQLSWIALNIARGRGDTALLAIGVIFLAGFTLFSFVGAKAAAAISSKK